MKKKNKILNECFSFYRILNPRFQKVYQYPFFSRTLSSRYQALLSLARLTGIRKFFMAAGLLTINCWPLCMASWSAESSASVYNQDHSFNVLLWRIVVYFVANGKHECCILILICCFEYFHLILTGNFNTRNSVLVYIF